MEKKDSSSSFTIGNSAQERRWSYVPDCYVIPSSNRPSLTPETANVPVIDFSRLRQDATRRANVITEIGNACRQVGFFQIVNHGICQSILDGALSVASDFFKLPTEEKVKFMSSDVKKPVRYGTSLKDGVLDRFQFWRVFLKHYAHPLSHWIHLWPKNPPHYRESMVEYCKEVKNIAMEIYLSKIALPTGDALMGAINESLGLDPSYLSKQMEDGMQVMAVNCYPPCPNPELALGLPPHSDYTCLTIVLQNSAGLELIDKREGKWKLIPDVHGALQVHIGDHLEVLSKGLYKSVVHRAILNSETTRISVASLHSMGMDEKMGTAEELVDDQHPKKYKESSFSDFLDFLCKNDISEGKNFIDTLKIKA